MHSTLSRPLAALLLMVSGVLATAGCQTVSYYSHAVAGQWRMLADREPVPEVLAELAARRDHDPEAALLYRRLSYSQRVLDFAEHELLLDVGRRYRTYVDLQRPAVVWNVFAAPPLSLEPYRWCYPIVGCAPYRGYFDPVRAERQARGLADRGLETYVGPVAAYSTLGWFADPLLSSFVTWPEADLAALLFHELAHTEVWVAGDVAFNESFATFVGRRGLLEWLRREGREDLLAEYRQRLAERRRLLDLLGRVRGALEAVYASDRSREDKLRAKAEVLTAAGACYQRSRGLLGGGRYDDLMGGLDNARLVSVATYEDLVPGFEALFESVDGRWEAFYDRVRALGRLDEAARREALAGSGHQQVAHAGDDHHTHEIECQALAGHLLDGEASR